jgi:hypothetical protein
MARPPARQWRSHYTLGEIRLPCALAPAGGSDRHALKKTMEGFQNQGYVKVQEVKRFGFFPMGMGSAVTGLIVSEYQLLYNLTLNDIELSSTEIFAVFGQLKFVLRTNLELKMMELFASWWTRLSLWIEFSIW